MKICRLQLKLLSLVFAFSCLGLLLSANTVNADTLISSIPTTDLEIKKVYSGDIASQSFTISGTTYEEAVVNKIQIRAVANSYNTDYINSPSKVDVRICRTVNCSGVMNTCANNDQTDCQIKTSTDINTIFGNSYTNLPQNQLTDENLYNITLELNQDIYLHNQAYWLIISIDNNGGNGSFYWELGNDQINGCAIMQGTSWMGFTTNCYSGSKDFNFIMYKDTIITPPAEYCGDGICNNGETDLTCIDCLTIYDMTTLQDTYLWFNNVIEYCPIDTSCRIVYHFDTSIFNYSDYGKLYYYPTSTSSPQFVKNISPLANNWELGEMGGGSFIASSTSTSTQFSYFQIVPCQNSGDCFGTSTVAVWYSARPDYAAIVSDLWPATSSTSTADMIDDFNMTVYHLTCSDEQWSGDWWTKLGCYIRFGEIVLQKKSVDILNNSMSKTWSRLKNIFPFNFANLVSTSWKNSSASSTPSELQFLDMLDDEGNISFDFSAMTGTTTKLKFWGADTFNNTNGEFTKVRTISKYLFYGLLILYIYLKGRSVYKEFIGNKDE